MYIIHYRLPMHSRGNLSQRLTYSVPIKRWVSMTWRNANLHQAFAINWTSILFSSFCLFMTLFFYATDEKKLVASIHVITSSILLPFYDLSSRSRHSIPYSSAFNPNSFCTPIDPFSVRGPIRIRALSEKDPLLSRRQSRTASVLEQSLMGRRATMESVRRWQAFRRISLFIYFPCNQPEKDLHYIYGILLSAHMCWIKLSVWWKMSWFYDLLIRR